MVRLAASNPEARRGGQDGFMFVELTIVATVMMVIAASLLGALQSLTNAGGRVQALVTNQETVRLGMDQLQRDVRAASQVDAFPVASSYSSAIQVELLPSTGRAPCSPTLSTQTCYIRWTYDKSPSSSTYEALLRQVMSGPASGATVLNRDAVVTNVRNLETGAALFTYYDSHANNLVMGNENTPVNVANCAIRLHVQVNSNAQPGPQPFSENIDVELRNRLPGGIVGCPA